MHAYVIRYANLRKVVVVGGSVYPFRRKMLSNWRPKKLGRIFMMTILKPRTSLGLMHVCIPCATYRNNARIRSAGRYDCAINREKVTRGVIAFLFNYVIRFCFLFLFTTCLICFRKSFVNDFANSRVFLLCLRNLL